MVRLKKVATPLALVLAVRVPPSVTPPRGERGGDDGAHLAHRVARGVPQLNHRLLGERHAAGGRGRWLGGDAEPGGGAGREGDGVRRGPGHRRHVEVQRAVADDAGDREPGEGRHPAGVGHHAGGPVQGAPAARDARRHGMARHADGVPRRVPQLDGWLLREGGAAGRRARGLGGDGELGRGAGGDRHRVRGGPGQAGRAEAQRPGPDDAGDGQVGERRHAARVGVGRQGAAQRPAAAGDRRGDRHARLVHHVPRPVAQLERRLLREGGAAPRRGGGLGRDRELGGRARHDGDRPGGGAGQGAGAEVQRPVAGAARERQVEEAWPRRWHWCWR